MVAFIYLQYYNEHHHIGVFRLNSNLDCVMLLVSNTSIPKCYNASENLTVINFTILYSKISSSL